MPIDTLPEKKVLPSILYRPDIENLNALMAHTGAKSEAQAVREALQLAVYYHGLKTAEELDFYPPTPKFSHGKSPKP